MNGGQPADSEKSDNTLMPEYRRSFIPGGTDFHRGDVLPVRADEMV